MLNIDDLLISVHVSEVPALQPLYDLSRQASVIPDDFDPLQFARLEPDHRLARIRAQLDRPPREDLLLEAEYGTWLTKEQQRLKNRMRARRRAMEAAGGGGTAVAEPVSDDLVWKLKPGHVSFRNRRARHGELIAAASEAFGQEIHLQGDYFYPKGGFRSWHTNKYDTPGWRMYVIDCEEPGLSYFRVKIPTTGRIYTHWDRPGTINFFRIDPDDLMWHCIGAPHTHRWSKGFVLPDGWQRAVLPGGELPRRQSVFPRE